MEAGHAYQLRRQAMHTSYTRQFYSTRFSAFSFSSPWLFLYTVAIVPRRITTSSGRSNDFPYRYAVPKVIDFPRYNKKCSRENEILRGILHVSRFLYTFCVISRKIDYILDIVVQVCNPVIGGQGQLGLKWLVGQRSLSKTVD